MGKTFDIAPNRWPGMSLGSVRCSGESRVCTYYVAPRSLGLGAWVSHGLAQRGHENTMNPRGARAGLAVGSSSAPLVGAFHPITICVPMIQLQLLKSNMTITGIG